MSSDHVVLGGRLHPLTPIRRAWLLLSACGWFLYGQLDNISEIHKHIGYLWMSGAAVLFTALIATAMTMSWSRTSFTVTTGYVEIEYGLLTRVHRHFPMDQIRTVDVQRPLWARVFGMALVDVRTQSESQKIEYLSVRDAEHIRDDVLRILRGVSPRTDDRGVIARVDSRMLALSILLDAKMMISLVFGAAAALVPYLVTGHFWSLAALLPWIRSAWAATGKRFPSDHGWTVREVPGGFQTQSGMFNRKQFTWQQDRISTVTFHQPVLWRSRNWVTVHAAPVGHTGAVVLPVATRPQAEKILAGLLDIEALKVLDTVHPAGNRARWCTPFWRACGYSENGAFAAGWRGMFLRQQITVARMDRVVTVEVSQGWWQRRNRVASVDLVMPGGPDVEICHRDTGEAQEIFAVMSDRALTETQAVTRIRRIRLSADTRQRTISGSGDASTETPT